MSSERAKILLEAAQSLHKVSKAQTDRSVAQGVMIAVKELRRLASDARNEHKVIQAKQRQERRDSEAKWKAFGY